MQSLICVARVDGPSALAFVLARLRGADIWAVADTFHTATTLSYHAIALGGTQVWVLEKDAEAAAALLADGPPLASSRLRGWRAFWVVFFLFQAFVPPSPFAVYLQPVRPRNEQRA